MRQKEKLVLWAGTVDGRQKVIYFLTTKTDKCKVLLELMDGVGEIYKGQDWETTLIHVGPNQTEDPLTLQLPK